MADLKKYVNYALGVINFDTKSIDDLGELMEKFVQFCDSYNQITSYYLIAHTETEVLHIHFVFRSLKPVQLMTYFNKLSNWFVYKYHLIRSSEGINIEKCENINAHLNYLLHQDKTSISKGKKQYSISDFVSNVDEEIIDTLIHSKKGQLDAYYLRDAVLDCDDDFQLMVMLGMSVYHRYSREIQTLKEMRVKLKSDREIERNERIQEKFLECIDDE